MTRSFIVLVIAFQLAILFSASAQDTANTIGHVSIASPTAASLGKYGDIPVGYHTGIPQVSVPVYTIHSGSLQLPVSLSYHAGGLKVQEASSWAGAGWSLNAGGAITRTVVGGPDDKGFSTSNLLFGHYTDFGYNNYYVNQSISQVDYLMTIGYADGEPDLYFFNFGGYTGKFYFNDDRTPMFVPEQDFKVQPFLASGSGFTGFIITTPDGTRYFFGKPGNNNTAFDPIEVTNPFTLQNGPGNTSLAASSWFLNKILSVDGMDSITFTYQKENYSYYTVSTFPVEDAQYLKSQSFEQNYGMNLVKNQVQGARLTAINFANGSISFTPAPSPRIDLSNSTGVTGYNDMNDNANTSSYALGSITINDGNGFCKKDSLYTSYFYDNTTQLPGNQVDFWPNFSSYNLHTDKYRLRLDSIQELSCDATLAVPPYRFSYFGELVRRRLSFAVDHWGYGNTSDTNRTLVPTLNITENGALKVISGANRDAAWPAMRGGTLSQITYPTGGATLFDFEPKNIYTFTQSVFESVPLTSLVAHWYGQGGLGQSNSFTAVGSGAVQISVTNYSVAWSPTLSVVDANNVQQGGGPSLINFAPNQSTPYTVTISYNLPPGTYTATLTYPTNASLSASDGATASVIQYQYVPNTSYVPVGGLRIKTITNKSATADPDVVTSYNYTGGGATTVGTLYSIPTYVQVVRNNIWKLIMGAWLPQDANGCAGLDGVGGHPALYSAGSIRPMANVQGENFGYGEVDVSQTGNGRSVYRYYGSGYGSIPNDVCVRSLIQSSFCDPTIPNFPAAPLPYDYMRDEPQYEGHFDQSGNVLKEVYHYPLFAYDPMGTPGIIQSNFPLFHTFTEYVLQTVKKTADSTVTFNYDPSTGNRIASTTAAYYESQFHHQPTRKISYTSTGAVLTTTTKYALDFRINSCDAIPDSLSIYKTIATGDTTWLSTALNACGANDTCLHNHFLTYRQMMAQARQNLLRFRRRSYAPDSANQQNNCYLAAQGSADTYLNPVLRLQQEYNNVPIEVSQFKSGNLRSASFTKYDNSVFPAGFAYPGKTRLISLQAPSSTFSNAVISGNTIALDSRYLDEATYSFSAGHPQQVTGHDGVAMSYLWDYGNKETIAKVANATVDQVAYTSFEADGTGSWTIPAGGRDNANSITGGSSYNLGNGAVSRSGLTSTSAYIVSYWSKTGASYSVTGSTSVQQGKTIALPTGGTWTYFEHTVTGVAAVSISGTGDVDELRLYPAGAQMTTYTYRPLLGMTSQCDVDNRVSYYEYDSLGRLRDIRDQDGNIVKTVQYHYAYGQQSIGY